MPNRGDHSFFDFQIFTAKEEVWVNFHSSMQGLQARAKLHKERLQDYSIRMIFKWMSSTISSFKSEVNERVTAEESFQ